MTMPEPAPGRRAERRAARTEAILETAMELLVEEGLEALTVQRVAASLDITAGALYRYFSSKDALLAELQVRLIGEVHGAFVRTWATLEPALADAPCGVASLARILAAVRGWLALHAAHPRRVRLLGQVLAEPEPIVTDPQTFGVVMAPAMALLRAVAEHFDAACAAGALAAGESGLRRAVVLWGSLQGTAQLHKLSRLGEPAFARDGLDSALALTLLRGWGAHADELDRACQLLRAEPTLERTR